MGNLNIQDIEFALSAILTR